MAYDRKTLIAHSQGPMLTGVVGTYTGYRQTLYSYATADAKATVLAAGYFNTANTNATAPLLKAGDVIDATFAVGGAIGAIRLIVTAAAQNAVTVAPFATS